MRNTRISPASPKAYEQPVAMVHEQRAASTGIAQGVEKIARMSGQKHAATRDSLTRADPLQALPGALDETVDHFRLR